MNLLPSPALEHRIRNTEYAEFTPNRRGIFQHALPQVKIEIPSA